MQIPDHGQVKRDKNRRYYDQKVFHLVLMQLINPEYAIGDKLRFQEEISVIKFSLNL